MRGYLSIRKRTSMGSGPKRSLEMVASDPSPKPSALRLPPIVLGPDGARGLVVSLSVGVIAGCLAASFKFHLGLPGHKALFWMTPVITARLLGRCRIGTTAGALTSAFVSIGLGGNLAGGALGLALVGAAGALIDACIIQLGKHKASTFATIMGVALSAMLANLICCAKRLLVPAGVTPHDVFSGVDFLLRPGSYGFFGFLAGLIAATGAHFARSATRLDITHKTGKMLCGNEDENSQK
jgi:hypothetical protein